MPIEVYVSEYIQVAHRLMNLPGKCTQIHGHSMHVTMYLGGEVNENGLIENVDGEVLDFSQVKKLFRSFLNTNYDHHLLLNKDDPWARFLTSTGEGAQGGTLPGLVKCEGDPTTENIAKWIFEAMALAFPVDAIEIKETATNGVTYSEGS